MADPTTSTLDQAEVARFAALADEWWNPSGKFKPLHRLGPERMAFIRDAAVGHFNRPDKGLRPLAGLTVLDVGCGGGLVAEPLARMGAVVTGIEPDEANIAAARAHAAGQNLAIAYRAIRAEGLVAEGLTLNRTLKSYALAIIGAEYVLRWVPAGTHQWDRFVTPAELAGHLTALGLGPPVFAGLIYNPLTDRWSLSENDVDVNYLAAAAKAS